MPPLATHDGWAVFELMTWLLEHPIMIYPWHQMAAQSTKWMRVLEGICSKCQKPTGRLCTDLKQILVEVGRSNYLQGDNCDSPERFCSMNLTKLVPNYREVNWQIVRQTVVTYYIHLMCVSRWCRERYLYLNCNLLLRLNKQSQVLWKLFAIFHR